jgi:hypothetical protein
MPSKPIKTIVFLPREAAAFVAGKLAENGFQPTPASSVAELHEALCSTEYALAVATRPDIDLIRHIQPMPVVNIEVFFDFEPNAMAASRSSRFDSAAFLRRVRALTAEEPAIIRPATVSTSRRGGSFLRLLERLVVGDDATGRDHATQG